MSSPILIIIEGDKYDITNYGNHPGINLEEYEGSDCTEQWNYYHPEIKQGKAHYILNHVMSRGEYNGIKLMSKL